MKPKPKSIFGIEPTLVKTWGFLDKSWKDLSKKLGNGLDKWLGNTPKSRQQERKEARKKQQKQKLEMITEQHQGLLEMQQAKAKSNTIEQINERFTALEAQDKENSKEASLDVDIEH